ncbi:hypothetical protein EVAR_66945_1 [Eumeta japonica]|uniref:Uncharacterized protein n=1 Tax=Eumeta variegata TaxID=151549 RepID=A0A4C1SAV4_EUMVA|nr:hypothetical protein EVAR_66945_1 [Eumeta japonica]
MPTRRPEQSGRRLPTQPIPDLNARCSSLPALQTTLVFTRLRLNQRGSALPDSSAPSLARSHFSDCDAFVTNLTMVQRTKLCRCDVSYESFAKALNRYATEKKEESGSVLTHFRCTSFVDNLERQSFTPGKARLSSALDDNRPKSFPRRTTADADGDVTERRPRSRSAAGVRRPAPSADDRGRFGTYVGARGRRAACALGRNEGGSVQKGTRTTGYRRTGHSGAEGFVNLQMIANLFTSSHPRRSFCARYSNKHFDTATESTYYRKSRHLSIPTAQRRREVVLCNLYAKAENIGLTV